MKQLVYRTPINSVEQLRGRTQSIATEIRADPNLIRRTQQSLIRRAEASVRNRG